MWDKLKCAATHHDLDTWLPYLLPVERLYVATDAAGEIEI